MKNTENYKVNSHDVDCNGMLSPTGYMRYMQDAAMWQFEHDGQPYEKLLEKGQAFLLSRFKAAFIKPVYSHEKITASSWALEESAGVSFKRSYDMARNGELVAVAKSIWALLDINTKRLCRVSEETMIYGTDKDVELDMPRRIKTVAETKKVGEHLVTYADADENHHMNNTVYADMVCSFIPDITNKRVTSIDISYLSEAPIGEKLEIFIGESEDGFYFKTVRSDGRTNIEAFVETENL